MRHVSQNSVVRCSSFEKKNLTAEARRTQSKERVPDIIGDRRCRGDARVAPGKAKHGYRESQEIADWGLRIERQDRDLPPSKSEWRGCDAARFFFGPGGVSVPIAWFLQFGKVSSRCGVFLCGF